MNDSKEPTEASFKKIAVVEKVEAEPKPEDVSDVLEN